MLKYGVSENIATLLTNNLIKKDVKRHLLFMEKHKIKIISIQDKLYPCLLKTIYCSPITLYIRGDEKILNDPCLAIVGCRNASNYGKKVAKEFAYNLSKCGFTIVSGLARGIDSCAHIGTIEVKRKTIAVLGNGLDMIYPKENLKLSEKILEYDGAIISEYPLGTEPKKENFPARNRIISGLSNGVLVIEAKERSGTLITTDYALEQGRDVFVIPGNIDSENSFGTNELIKQGAKLVTNYKEIIEEYQIGTDFF